MHEKQDPSATAIETIEANLVPVEGEADTYVLDTDAVTLDSRFKSNKLKAAGAGIACLTVDGHDAIPDAEKLPVLVKANRQFKYTVSFNGEGTLKFTPERLMGTAEPGETWTFRLYVMTNDGKYIETTFDLTKPGAEETSAPEETPVPEETPEPTPEGTEEPSAPAAAEKDGNGGLIAVIVAAVIVVAGAAFLIFRKKQK